MINLHVYPSPLTHDSRIEREVETIASLKIFGAVVVAGVSAQGLPKWQRLADDAYIQRFAADTGSHGLWARAWKTVGFGRAVLKHYSSEPLSVINCHNVAALPACVALKKATGAQLVYDPHELETEAPAAVGIRRPMYKFAERAGIGHVDHTFTVTKSIEEWYREVYGLTSIDTVYNYPSRAQVSGTVDRSYFRRLFNLGDSVRVYLYQGLLEPGRGLETIARVFDAGLGRESAVVFLGHGPLESQVKGWASAMKNVFFHPSVHPGELSSFTAAADVGLALTSGAQCLSYYYSAPNKIFQYWHAGIPVIASRLPEHERFLDRYSAGTLCDSGSVDSFVEACRSLDRKDSAQLSSGIAKAARELRWENYVDLFRERYTILAARAASWQK